MWLCILAFLAKTVQSYFSLMQEMKEVAFLKEGSFSKHDFLFLFESWLSIYSLYSSLWSQDHVPQPHVLNILIFQVQEFS